MKDNTHHNSAEQDQKPGTMSAVTLFKINADRRCVLRIHIAEVHFKRYISEKYILEKKHLKNMYTMKSLNGEAVGHCFQKIYDVSLGKVQEML